MEGMKAARIALARLAARRFGREVPTREILIELAGYGVAHDDALRSLEGLARDRVAHCTANGWRLVSPPVTVRAREPIASFAWIH